MLVLTLVALVSRTWALTELYDFLDLETIDWIVQSRTWRGYLGYLDYGFVQNNGGAVQLLPTQLVYRLFGTSIFTLRMTLGAVGHRRGAAHVHARPPPRRRRRRRLRQLLPHHRARAALLGAQREPAFRADGRLRAGHRPSGAVDGRAASRSPPLLANALWMPWCRWFYSACMVAFLIPIASPACTRCSSAAACGAKRGTSSPCSRLGLVVLDLQPERGAARRCTTGSGSSSTRRRSTAPRRGASRASSATPACPSSSACRRCR